MRRRIARLRDTFDTSSLVDAGPTELDHRTAPGSPSADRNGTIYVLALQVALALVLALPTKLLAVLPIPAVGAIFLPVIAWLLLDAFFNYLRTRATLRGQLGLVAAVAAAWGLYWVLSFQLTSRQTYLLLFGAGVLAAALVSHAVAKQFAYWMTVNVRLGRDAVRRWQGYWGYIGKPVTPRGCPEIESYRVGLLCLPIAYAVGFVALVLAERTGLASYGGLASVAAFAATLTLLWLAWSTSRIVPWMPPGKVLATSWKGVVTWYRYNHHQTIAPGVFQFPTVVFRRLRHRHAATFVPLFLLTLTMAQMEVRPISELVRGKAAELAAGRPVDGEAGLGGLTERQRVWYDQLAGEEERAAYLREALGRNSTGITGRELPRWTAVTILQGLAFLAGVTVAPVGLFLLVFAATAGRLLVAYHDALEADDAAEVEPDAWPWDNRVSRLMNSENPLERDHVYLGRSVHGDYPVLLHLKLLHQHAHILGDTGSRKTSVGIAPLLTQLIGRADASVLILDLKGDKGLFECARHEAAQAGLPFQFFTNVVDRASHVFNPLRQSHTDTLTIHQKTQPILQALSLEHGEAYGAGYYSAINEIVLKEYLEHYRSIDSFRRLSGLVRVPQAYRAAGGDPADWKEARHLAIQLDKLASVYPMNLTEDDLRDRPEAWRDRIDMPGLLDGRRVVYFSLSSAMEPTTVSPIARLALFNLLTAAAQREGRAGRVYVFIDEFQRIVTENVRLFLEQARSMKLHFVLANQTMGQLRGRGLDLVDTVESCTAFKQMFKATDLTTLQHLEQISGEALYHENQWGAVADAGFDSRRDLDYGDDDPRALQTREGVGPRLERNTLIELSAASWLSIVRFTEGSGFTRYSGYLTPIAHEYHIPEAVYAERMEEPWPEASASTVTRPGPASTVAAGPGTAAAAPPPEGPTPGSRVRSIIDRLDQAPAAPVPPTTSKANHEPATNDPR